MLKQETKICDQMLSELSRLLRIVGQAYEIESIQFPANFIGGINQSGTWLAVLSTTLHAPRSTLHSPLTTLATLNCRLRTVDCRLSLIAARNRPQSAWRAQTQSF